MAGICAAQATTKDQSKLNLFRRFRDQVFSQSEIGQEYTKLYYSHSPETAWLLLEDSKLRSWTGDMLDHLVPGIRLLLEGNKVELSWSLKQDLLELLSEISKRGSPELRASIKMVTADIEEGIIEKFLDGIELRGKEEE